MALAEMATLQSIKEDLCPLLSLVKQIKVDLSHNSEGMTVHRIKISEESHHKPNYLED